MSFLPLFLDLFAITRVFLVGCWSLDPQALEDCFSNVHSLYTSFGHFSPCVIMSASSEAVGSSVSLAMVDRSPEVEVRSRHSRWIKDPDELGDLGDIGDEIDDFPGVDVIDT